jgi:hypothetical protein
MGAGAVGAAHGEPTTIGGGERAPLDARQHPAVAAAREGAAQQVRRLVSQLGRRRLDEQGSEQPGGDLGVVRQLEPRQAVARVGGERRRLPDGGGEGARRLLGPAEGLEQGAAQVVDARRRELGIGGEALGAGERFGRRARCVYLGERRIGGLGRRGHRQQQAEQVERGGARQRQGRGTRTAVHEATRAIRGSPGRTRARPVPPAPAA